MITGLFARVQSRLRNRLSVQWTAGEKLEVLTVVVLSWLCVVVAVIGSLVAEYFSISGLTKLYSAGGPDIVLLGATAATAGLVGIVWLHSHWADKERSWSLKLLVLALLVGHVCLTNAGIFGRLSADYLAEQAPSANRDVELRLLVQRQTQDKELLGSLRSRQVELDALVHKLTDLNAVSRAIDLRNQQTKERQSLQEQQDHLQSELANLAQQASELQNSNATTDAHLGPLKYLAVFMGYSDPAAAERAVTLLVMLSFDPLNIALLLAGAGGVVRSRKPEPEPVYTQPPELVAQSVEVTKPELVYAQPEPPPKTDNWFVPL